MSRNKGQATGKSSRPSCTRTKLRFFRLGIACATIEPDARNGWACRAMTATIFVSYASEDHTVARTICEALENRGFSCWIASRDIQPGENFQVAIVRAIRPIRSRRPGSHVSARSAAVSATASSGSFSTIPQSGETSSAAPTVRAVITDCKVFLKDQRTGFLIPE